MSSESNKVVKPDERQNAQQTVDQSRRSFAKVGAAVVPVMMTLANRSAWGGTNICTQSGFTSFTNQNGVVSHSANNPNPLWKNPENWAATSTWPEGFGQAKYRFETNGKSYTSNLWGGSQYKIKEVLDYENGKDTDHPNPSRIKVLVASVLSSVTDETLTILDVLSNGSLMAYRMATLLNNAVSPVPSYFLTDQVTLAEFKAFYSACAST